MTYNVFSGTLNPTHSLTLTRCIAEEECILVTAVCVSLAAFPHYCMDPDVNWGNGRCTIVVCYWVDLQLVHGFRCCDNIAPIAKCQRVLVLALCLVIVNCGTDVTNESFSCCCVD